MENTHVQNKEAYKGLRLIYNRKRGTYEIVEATYNEIGDVIDVVPTNVMGTTLAEAKENLLCLLSDIDNWVDEEFTLLLT